MSHRPSVETARFDNNAHMAVVVCDARCRNSMSVGSMYPDAEYITDRASGVVTQSHRGEHIGVFHRYNDFMTVD